MEKIKLKSELEEIRYKRDFHEKLLQTLQGKIKCLKSLTNVSKDSLDYYNDLEELIITEDKFLNHKKAVEIWENRISVWEEKFEHDSMQANSDWNKLVEMANKIKDSHPQLNVALININSHDLSDQNTKNKCYEMIRIEFMQGVIKIANQISRTKSVLKTALSNYNNLQTSKQIEKYNIICEQIYPNLF
jgi:hypothetical protein